MAVRLELYHSHAFTLNCVFGVGTFSNPLKPSLAYESAIAVEPIVPRNLHLIHNATLQYLQAGLQLL
jgi:hypothetical protein